MPCSHLFHENCIIKWLLQKNFCPLCKKSYNFGNNNSNHININNTNSLEFNNIINTNQSRDIFYNTSVNWRRRNLNLNYISNQNDLENNLNDNSFGRGNLNFGLNENNLERETNDDDEEKDEIFI